MQINQSQKRCKTIPAQEFIHTEDWCCHKVVCTACFLELTYNYDKRGLLPRMTPIDGALETFVLVTTSKPGLSISHRSLAVCLLERRMYDPMRKEITLTTHGQ